MLHCVNCVSCWKTAHFNQDHFDACRESPESVTLAQYCISLGFFAQHWAVLFVTIAIGGMSSDHVETLHVRREWTFKDFSTREVPRGDNERARGEGTTVRVHFCTFLARGEEAMSRDTRWIRDEWAFPITAKRNPQRPFFRSYNAHNSWPAISGATKVENAFVELSTWRFLSKSVAQMFYTECRSRKLISMGPSRETSLKNLETYVAFVCQYATWISNRKIEDWEF